MSLALRKVRRIQSNTSTHSSLRPHLENVAVPNSGCANWKSQIYGDLVHSIVHIPLLPLAHRNDAETDCSHYSGKKLSRAARLTPPRAARGMATTSCYEKSCSGRIENSQAARRIRTVMRRLRMITGWLCGCLARLSVEHESRPWRLWLASDHAHQPAVCLSSLRSYYLS